MKKLNLQENRKRKKRLLAILAVAAAGIAVAVICINMMGNSEPVEFEEVEEKELPGEIVSDIIPEYKSLERALACIIDDDVYVVVTRGEKPTSGYKVSIDSMVVEKEKDKENLIVYANFRDPDKKTAFSQIITYPTQVVKTDLKALPDNIELRIQY